MFSMFTHLLPNARAWRLTANKQLREFFQGLSDGLSDITVFIDNVYLDIFPQTTRELDKWEEQFGLASTELNEQGRRDRLDGAWKALGGQDPRYIQDTLRDAGFDVYIHEWWEPSPTYTATLDNPVVTCGDPQATCGTGFVEQIFPPNVRNPLLHIRGSTAIIYVVECGETVAECGEVVAQCGNSSEVQGYPLVNITGVQVVYNVPNDPTKWPYFLYVGGQTFGNIATVEPARKTEFEQLLLKICPSQVWIGVLVNYN